MSLPRFFLDEQVIALEQEEVFPLMLSKEDAKHAKVLRLKAGEHVAVVDAATDYFECEIVCFDDLVPLVRVTVREGSPVKRASVVLVQGLAKGDKMDEVIRHATELGVSEFIPLACERSVVKLDAKKAEARKSRWQGIAKSAAMQSGQPRVPSIGSVSTIAQACHALSDATAVLVCWEESDGSTSISQALRMAINECDCACEDSRVAVVVGPEGGLSQREVDQFLSGVQRGYCVSLGPSILRTETAGIVAPALTLYELGALGPR